MRRDYRGEIPDNGIYVILKVDNVAVVRDARITQVIKNPLTYFLEGKMDITCDSMIRASWK